MKSDGERAHMTCPDVMDLERYVLRELDEPARANTAAHVAQCAACAQQVAELEENLRLAPSLRRGAHAGAGSRAARDADPASPPLADDWFVHAELPPDTVGPYRILRKLGEGGMGSVFEAQQENPRRTVALKMIRPGLVSGSLLARFRHEAQVLGRLRHPGIAQIYEAGTHQPPSGPPQPYFAMELVHGLPLAAYCQAKKLGVRARLELLARVCDAVEHAHQRGVIHRDLKPDNILVDDHGGGGEPQPKILDFGVARVVDPEAQHTTLHTSVGQIVGTVAYMSPEQAAADPAELDTRSDVYALGVICYELLSGRLPYKLNRTNVAESVRAIAHDDPTPLASIDRSLRGDVTTIVAKALEKEKARRYGSAAEMAADIRRHLKDEPITAHPPSTIYQIGKFARRNKGLVAGVVAAFFILWLGVIGTGVGIFQARRAADVARAEAAKAKAVNQFLNEMLASSNPQQLSKTDRAKGPGVTMVEVLNEASARLAAGSLAQQPEIEAAVRRTVGHAYIALGEYDEAEDHYARALAIDRQRFGSGPHPDVADDLSQLGVAYQYQAKYDRAAELCRASLDMRRKLFDEDSVEVAQSMLTLAAAVRDQGDLPEAERLFTRALDVQRRVLGEQDPAVATTLNLLGVVLENQSRLAEAEQAHRRAIEIRQQRFGDEHPDVASARFALGVVLHRQDHNDQAHAMFRQALDVQRRLLGEDHPDVGRTVAHLGVVARALGKLDDVEASLRLGLEIERKRLGDEHPTVATHMNNLAMALSEQGKLAEAEVMLRRVLEIRRKALGPDHPDVGGVLNNVAGMLKEQGKLVEAEAMFREAMELRRRALGDAHPEVGTSMFNLAAVILMAHRPADAEPLCRRSLAIMQSSLGEQHVLTATMHAGLGACLADLERFDEAEPELRRAYDLFLARFGPRDKRTLGMARRLIGTYEVLGKADDLAALRTVVAATQPAAASASDGAVRSTPPTQPATVPVAQRS